MRPFWKGSRHKVEFLSQVKKKKIFSFPECHGDTATLFINIAWSFPSKAPGNLMPPFAFEYNCLFVKLVIWELILYNKKLYDIMKADLDSLFP